MHNIKARINQFFIFLCLCDTFLAHYNLELNLEFLSSVHGVSIVPSKEVITHLPNVYPHDEIIVSLASHWLHSETVEFVIGFVHAHNEVHKVLGPVFVRNPKDSVLCFYKSNQLLSFICPFIRLITPVTVPLKFAPWISNAENFGIIILVVFYIGTS